MFIKYHRADKVNNVFTAPWRHSLVNWTFIARPTSLYSSVKSGRLNACWLQALESMLFHRRVFIVCILNYIINEMAHLFQECGYPDSMVGYAYFEIKRNNVVIRFLCKRILNYLQGITVIVLCLDLVCIPKPMTCYKSVSISRVLI